MSDIIKEKDYQAWKVMNTGTKVWVFDEKLPFGVEGEITVEVGSHCYDYQGQDAYVDYFEVNVAGNEIPVTDSEICPVGDWLSAESRYFWIKRRDLHKDVLETILYNRGNTADTIAATLKLDPIFTEVLLLRMNSKGIVVANNGAWDVSPSVRREHQERMERYKRILQERANS